MSIKIRKAVLINPGWDEIGLWEIKSLRLPPLGLATIASLFPDNWEVKIIDENVDGRIDCNRIDSDIACISVMTPLAPRAYEISAELRKRGIITILGGPHPTLLPDEAINYCDVVVIGEAEGVLNKGISDFENNNLQKIYSNSQKSQTFPDVYPRHDLFKKNKYFAHPIQATRGCPYDCEFCAVSEIYGRKYRKREVDYIIKEIETIKDNNFFFADDNLIGGKIYRDWSTELFKKLCELNKLWATQVSIDFADEPSLLKLASKAGCKCVYIGIESRSKETLKQMGKVQNINRDYKKAIKNFHDHGIAVTGAFIFGYDEDDRSIFESTVEYIDDINLDAAMFSILTPLPGTRLYKRLKESNRIFKENYPKDWKLYDLTHAVFKPNKMSPDELESGLLEAYNDAFKPSKTLKRFIKTFLFTKNVYAATFHLYFNRGMYNAVKREKSSHSQ